MQVSLSVTILNSCIGPREHSVSRYNPLAPLTCLTDRATETEIIEHPSSCYIIGRSGTG